MGYFIFEVEVEGHIFGGVSGWSRGGGFYFSFIFHGLWNLSFQSLASVRGLYYKNSRRNLNIGVNWWW
jgi:hypothetical protein